jgi:uncharacterized protein YbjT (DUF2867 family)
LAIAFVTGATGFTGRQVVRALRDHGVETVAHVRPDNSRLDEWRERFSALGARVDTTPWEAEAMRLTFAELRPDVVLSLTGTTMQRARQAKRSGEEGADFTTVDFGLRKLLLDALIAAGLSARFVELSTVAVSARSPSSYLRLRWRTEQAIRDSGLPYTIVRPAFIVGSGRDDPRVLEYAVGGVVNGFAVVAGALGFKRFGARYRSITNVELADAIARHALDPASAGQVVEGRALRGSAPSPETT